MIWADLFISSRDWLWPAAIFLVVAMLFLVWNYRSMRVSSRLRVLCWTLKALGITALLVCLLEPLWSGTRARPGANFFAVLVDHSMGLQIKDTGQTQTRADQLKYLVTEPQSKWQELLDQNFSVRRYFFDSKLESTRDFSELNFEGKSSTLNTALRQIAERFRGQPLAGILVLTDGNATDISTEAFDGGGLPPVYPVTIGKDETVRDVALQKVTVNQTPFEDAPVTVSVQAAAPGYGGSNLVVQLKEIPRSGQATVTPPQEQKQTAQKLSHSQYRFQLKPARTGISFFQATAAIPGAEDEATVLNNAQTLVVDRGHGPYRILYISGRPNWEFKYLNRAVQEDDQLHLTGLIRIAKREPKFEFRSRRGETSNPLFRGFDKTDETTERYDQPVLIRLNTLDESELKAGFPKTEEELYQYHAIIMDDLEGEFFSREQMSLIQRFVSERGGGFMMLGGQESFGRGKFEKTPIGDILPVYLERLPKPRVGSRWKLALTREGWLQPWARLRSTEDEEKKRLEEMPGFEVLNVSGGLRPGARIISSVTDGVENAPALVVQQYGLGKSGALLVGDLWRWGLSSESGQKDLAQAWRQMVRWLVSDVPGRFAIEVLPGTGESAGGVVLQVKAKDAKFLPLDNASVQLSIEWMQPGATNESPVPIQLTAEPHLAEAGVYQAAFVPREAGGYLVQATIQDMNGKEIGKAHAGWTSDPAATEFASLKPNRALLETISRSTGGEMVELGKLESFAKALPMKNAPITEPWTYPLWHQPTVFLFALICFLGEWGLRRWKGLA